MDKWAIQKIEPSQAQQKIRQAANLAGSLRSFQLAELFNGNESNVNSAVVDIPLEQHDP
jgi:hypothetical protein